MEKQVPRGLADFRRDPLVPVAVQQQPGARGYSNDMEVDGYESVLVQPELGAGPVRLSN